MNFARIAAAAVVAWIVSLAVGFFVNTVLLVDLASANTLPMRPQSDVMGVLPVGFVFLLIGFFAFAYAYAKGHEGENGVMEGIRFGVLTSLIVIGFGLIWQYVVYPISGAMSAALIIDSVVEMALYGGVVGAIYKPVPRAARTAGV
jgi:hypothetical protein